MSYDVAVASTNASTEMSPALGEFLTWVAHRNPHQPEFLQAVREFAEAIMPWYETQDAYKEARILERVTEPDRAISFRVCWTNDAGQVEINRGYRVQFNGAIGPYKGGLRFHPTVNLSILKFLGFEQCFKNSLTTLPMGGGKGGSDFDPKDKSDREVMRFCQSFMLELWRHIGPDTDVPAGDIGVGGREIGYMFGQYRRLSNEWTGTLTGKDLSYGGSFIRPEATGYGAVYFMSAMLEHTRQESLVGKRCLVSGSGNVAQYTVQKLNHLGAKVITLSDSDGTIHDPAGIDAEKLAWVMDLKNVRRGRISEYAEHFSGVEYRAATTPWGIVGDLAFPSATQNELSLSDARTLVENGLSWRSPRVRICRRRWKRRITSSTTGSISRRARPPTRAELPCRGWRCRRTPRGRAGPGKKSISSCRGSWKRSTRNAYATAPSLMGRSTMCRARTLPASARSPMRCSRMAWCSAFG